MQKLGWYLVGLYALAQAVMLLGVILWGAWRVAHMPIEKLLGMG